MSDFLTNLAARALAAPTLRPRTRLRFEPERETSPWLPGPAAEGDETPAAHAPHRLQPAGPEVKPDREADVSDDSAPRTFREQEPEPHVEARRLASSPGFEQDGIPMTAAPAVEAPVAAIVSATTPRAVQITERLTERVVETRDTTVRIEPADSRAADEPEPRQRPRHRHEEQPPRIQPERRASQTEPLPREARRTAQRQTGDVTGVSSEAVIHVSIGRVEVRAVAPSAPPPRSRAKNTPMTIEEYAAKRNAKGRP